MNCKPVSVTTGPPSLAVYSSKYLLYDFNATNFQKKIFLDILLLLVPLEILSHYPDIDISHWLGEDFQWIMDKAFKEKLLV